MGKRKFDTSTVKTLSTFGLGQSRADREYEEKQKQMAEDIANMPQRIPSSDLGQGFSMEESIEPWEIAGDAPVFLICPDCKVDVEEVKEPSIVWKPCGELVAGGVPGFKSAFCYCPKCGVQYFQIELMRNKSWRRDIKPE